MGGVMGLKIIHDARQDVVVSAERLWLTADRERVVGEGHRDAAFLLCGKGGTLLRSEAERLGLVESAEQYAVRAAVADPTHEIVEPVAAAPDADLEAMKVAELRSLADDLGVDHAGLKKADLVAALDAATTAEPADGERDN